MKMRTSKCRIWWPAHLSSTPPESFSASTLLFGWFVSSSPASLDIVVAFSCDEASIASSQSNLQEILHEIDGNMAVNLQDKGTFTMLGNCATDFGSNNSLLKVGRVIDDHDHSCHESACSCGQYRFQEKQGRWNCGCCKLDGFLDRYCPVSIGNYWAQLVYGSCENSGRNIKWIPKLHHVHWNAQTMLHFDLHVIVYETPRFGSHHFSLGFDGSKQVMLSSKKPKWVEDLHQTRPLLDLDTVITAINSAGATKLLFEGKVCPERYGIWCTVVCPFMSFTWKLLAMTVASFSTLLYIILQILHIFLSCISESCLYVTSEKIFSNTWEIIHHRCCQILYWPVFHHGNGLRYHSCVEYMEKAALQKHIMWSSVVVDILLGNIFGIALVFHVDSACLWVSNLANDITTYLLRTGCVWLMGIPAGFKLNTELAGVLGMLSLNAIQIWCNLWSFVGSFCICFIKGLSISGILFGLTIPAAIIIDIISLATVHVSLLHWFLSLIYSWQIQAIAALWRLFRGRKWNPLRLRFDHYDYSVQQHIVGSLLFTPLILLLPTTSLFYIFFTIMNSSIIFSCILIEVAISFILTTHYTKIFLWLVMPRRLPTGVWFEILSCQHNADIGTSEIGCATTRSQSLVLVSFLCSNVLNSGQIIRDTCKHVYSSVSKSSIASLAYGILSGSRIPSALGTSLPPKLPWMCIPCKDYWCLCRDAVLSCKTDCWCHVLKESNKKSGTS